MSEITKLIDKVDKLSELVEKIAVLMVRQDAHESDMGEVKDDLKALESKVSKMEIEVAVANESASNHEKISKATNDAIKEALKFASKIAAGLIIAGVVGAVTVLTKIN